MLNYMELDRALVAETNAQIFELEAQISALQNSISPPRANQQLVLERLNSYKYPVLTLPMDVVSEIFVHFLPPYPIRPPPGGTSSPTILTHICRHWRAIALALPALWRAINLTSPRKNSRANHAHAALLAPLWLERSGCLPLSIEAADFDDDGSLPVFSNLLPYCARWEHIALSLPDANPLGTIGHSMPLLRSLDLWLRGGLDNPIVIQDVPFLRTVVLNDFGSPSISLPWSQLTSIALSSLYPNHTLAILRQTPHLIDCTLDFWSMVEPHDNPLEDVVLLRLETLVFDVHSDIDVEFFESLVTPALHCLEVSEDFLSSNERPTESLEAYISKSGCKLRELRITNATVLARIYYEAFPSIPSIKRTESGASQAGPW